MMQSRGMPTLFVAVGLSILIHAASPSYAQTQIVGSKTQLYSSSDRMISLRHQDHMWITSDGAIHAVINEGTLGSPGAALALHTSLDHGTSWTRMISFASTVAESTSDGVLVNDELLLTYSTTASSQIVFARLQYDPLDQTWAVTSTETAFASPNTAVTTPALAIDAQQRVWLTFVSRQLPYYQWNTQIIWKEIGQPVWQNDGLTLGTISSSQNQLRSARPIAVPGGVGAVFSQGISFSWASRLDVAPEDAEWSESPLYTRTGSVNDPYTSHYSVTSDELGNLHFVTVDEKRVVYLRFDAASQTWDAPRTIFSGVKVAYVQVTTSPGRVYVLFNYGVQHIRVLESANNGATFALAYKLVHRKATPTENFSYPRIETPSRVSDSIPALQQYTESGIQRLLYFWIPLVP